jgi:COP9 signalosome complex subunit 7
MTSAVLVNLDVKITSIAADSAATKLNQQEHERMLQLNLKDVYDKQKEKSLGGAMATRRGPIPASDRENMMMDVDEPDNKGKNRKYVIQCLLFLVFC